jgi:hypothetical protein
MEAIREVTIPPAMTNITTVVGLNKLFLSFCFNSDSTS